MSKKQWKNVDMPVQFSSASTKTDWAEEEVEAPLMDVNAIRSCLPTATSATRQQSEIDSIPAGGPFILHFANVSFEATEDDVQKFFQNIDIANIQLNERKRGSGFIEFKDLFGLKSALALNDKYFLKRQIRLFISKVDELGRGRNSGQKVRSIPQQQQPRSVPTPTIDDSDNWRVRKPQPVPSHKELQQEDSGGSVFRRSVPQQKSGWKPNQQPQTKSDDSKASIDSMDSWRKPKGSELQIVKQDEQSVTFGQTSNTDKNEIDRMLESSTRTDDSYMLKKSSIFGDAKPIDTRQKDLEIEEKLEKNKSIVSPIQVDACKTTLSVKKAVVANPYGPVGEKSRKISDGKEVRKLQSTQVIQSATQQSMKDSLVKDSLVKQDVSSTMLLSGEQTSSTDKKQEPLPAPLPKVNIWDERKKIMSQSVHPNKQGVKSPPAHQTQEDQFNRKQQLAPDSNNNNINDTSISTMFDNTTLTPVSTSTSVLLASATSVVPVDGSQDRCTARNVQKVAVSVNGPFIDPHAHKPSQPLVTDTSFKRPTAVPKASITTVATNKEAPSMQPTARPVSRDVSVTTMDTPPKNNFTSPQSSWAKGPPKALLEKAEHDFGQNVIRD